MFSPGQRISLRGEDFIITNVKNNYDETQILETEDVSRKGHWGNGDYMHRVHPGDEIEYALYLIKQAYEKQL